MPIITLAAAISQLNLLNPREIDTLMREDPQLLSSKSSELVQRQLISNEELHHALALTAGIVEVDAANFELPDLVFDVQLLNRMHTDNLLFLGASNESVIVATWYPTDENMHKRLRTLTHHKVQMVWADREAIAARLKRMDHPVPRPAFELGRHSGLLTLVPMASDTVFSAVDVIKTQQQDMEYLMAEALQAMISLQVQEAPQETKETKAPKEPHDTDDSANMVRRLIMDAQELHASDIHFETNPGEQVTRIRWRQDGHLALYRELPSALCAAMVSRIKVMAKLDVSERFWPQEGKIDFGEFGGDSLELRVSAVPTHDGMEDVVVRLLASSSPVSLAKLGLQPRDVQVLTRMSARSVGLILAAGPTGSGKMTLLHSLLAKINTDERKIWTAEDPIKITQPGLRQVQVNAEIGLTYANALQGFLQADPDVIMVGEIRDHETAAAVMQASLTGHLVLSTLPTPSVSKSVERFLELGIDAMNFSDSLVGLVAQRLVMLLCPHCSHNEPPAAGQFTKLVKEYVYASSLSEAEGSKRLLAAAGVAAPEEVRMKTAHGCNHCENKGYKGRIGIFEIMENSPEMRLLIQRNAPATEIYQEAIRAGMHSLRHDALEKVVQGLIDLPQARLAYL